MNEAETRAELIDPALKAAGWGAVPGSRIRREYAIAPGRIEGRGRRGKPLTADYVLDYRNSKLGVVEAKADEEEVRGPSCCKGWRKKGLAMINWPRCKRSLMRSGAIFLTCWRTWPMPWPR